MSQTLQPITLWGHDSGANPWKVTMILEELNIPYDFKIVNFKHIKEEPYVSLNPNGRLPTIEDPNTGIKLWESGAIIEYLIENYDKDHTISFIPGSQEYYETKQWLYFQVSGQGPYFGQAMWFSLFHPEKLPSAIDRYVNEIRRVTGVLDRVLENKKYLVGDKYSFCDASFVTWYGVLPIFADRIDVEKDFPHFHDWLERLKARPAIAKILKDRETAMAAAKESGS